MRLPRTAMPALVAALLAATAGSAGTAHAARPDGGHPATQEALERAVAAKDLPGAGATARRDGRTWHGATGAADLATGRAWTPRDHFRAGSITKTFTAVVLLQLQQEGVLDLDDTVERWLPGVVRGHGNDGRRITLRRLLNHTSGLPNYFDDPALRAQLTGPAFFVHRYDTKTPRDLLRAALRHPPVFEPGTGWRYSNTNYTVAGMVIERATGHSYAEEATRRVLVPLGLAGTSFPGTTPTLPEPHPVEYALGPPGGPLPWDATAMNPSWYGAAGELVTTTGDLNRFYGSLLAGRLLGPAAMAEMFDGVATGVPGVDAYGLGVFAHRLPCGVTVWGHDGGTVGGTSDAVGTPGGRHTLAFHINGDWLLDADALTGVADAEFCPAGT
ncbi:serine hydrolase domain-containing protein [Streptomyces sp. B1866]|uniref:serine hydrolase domain-containing protein n=1 Tax=Streptomyces sp. B1866 TaxID=3075431 RepID=UPI00288F64EF|nr:serine hydrolase domain-containing protein [Streptomyces sp. B1866]MDT3399710.1 serine hydrolase domain-containing protein [Streptomyces sp. B1866]